MIQMTRDDKFVPAKYQCPDCRDIIFSRSPGEFVRCSCEACFVDQTEYYIRVGGPAEPVDDNKESN